MKETTKLKAWKEEQRFKISDWSLRLKDIREEMEAEGRLDLAETVQQAEDAVDIKYHTI